MQIFKRIVCIIFLIAVNSLFWFCIEPANYYRCALHEVQDESINYDLIIVGQSHGQYAYNPAVLEESSGMKAYNLCRHFVNASEIPYIAMEANYRNNVKRIIYDIDSTYWLSNENTNYYRGEYILPAISNPITKARYVFAENLTENYRYTLCRYIVRGSDDIKKIPDNVKRKLSKDYKEYNLQSTMPETDMGRYVERGYIYGLGDSQEEYQAPVWNSSAVSEDTVESFKILVNYCKKEDIDLIVVTSPQPVERVESSNYEEYHQYFSNLCQNEDVRYIDYNADYDGALNWSRSDFRDGEGHMKGEFSAEFSKDIAKIVSERK